MQKRCLKLFSDGVCHFTGGHSVFQPQHPALPPPARQDAMTEKLTVETAIAHRAFDVAGKPNEKVDVLMGKLKLFDTDMQSGFAATAWLA